MRSELFRKLMTMPMSFYNQTKFGRIISRMTLDIDSVRAGVQDVVFVLVVQGFQMIGSAVLMAWYDWKLFSLMLILAPIIWVVNENYRHEMSRRLRKVQESWSRVASTLAESVSGIRVTQAFVRHEVNAGFFRKLIDVHGENNVGVAQASAVFVPLMQLKSQLFLGAMALLGAFGVLRWHGWLHMEVGDLIMFFFLANLFFDPVQTIGNQLNQAFMAMAGAERLFRMLDQKPEWVDAQDAKPAPVIKGRVEFQDVNFEYAAGRPVLQDISFTAEPGQTVALVGHTGSGKTTLVGLLQKFYLPASGHVLVDGADLNRSQAIPCDHKWGAYSKIIFSLPARCWTTSGSRSRKRLRKTCVDGRSIGLPGLAGRPAPQIANGSDGAGNVAVFRSAAIGLFCASHAGESAHCGAG